MASMRQTKVVAQHQMVRNHVQINHPQHMNPFSVLGSEELFIQAEVTTTPVMLLNMTKLPLGYPQKEKDSKRINNLLQFSLIQQDKMDISDSSAFVTLVVHKCLLAIGVPNKMVSGYRNLNGTMQPHMWLKVNDYYIESSLMRGICEGAMKFLQDEYPDSYKEEAFKEENITAFDDEDGGKDYFMKKRITFCKEEPDMALALAINSQHAYNYYFEMIRYVYKTFHTTVEGIDPRVRYQCWGCNTFPRNGLPYVSNVAGYDGEAQGTDPEPAFSSNSSWRFFQCNMCMVANYCCELCQRDDWRIRHRYTCAAREFDRVQPLGSTSSYRNKIS